MIPWLLRLALALIGVFWIATVLIVAARRRAARWRIGPESPGPGRGGRVSVVIPARDEVDNIEACVRSVLAQDVDALGLLDAFEVIVVDDGSADGTGALLDELAAAVGDRLRVIHGGDAPLPTGWLGKPWACARGAAEATGDWLLFVDADVRLHPHALGAALAWAVDRDLGMLSGLGHLETGGFWEKVLQPVVGGLIVAGHDLDRINDPEGRRPRPLANGQFMLLRRDAYEAVGGHAAVRDAILDDMGLAVAVIGAGFSYNIVMMRALFTCRMYSSLGELWAGWSKNLFTGMQRSWGTLVLLSLGILYVNLVPWALVVLGLTGVIGAEWLAWGLGLVAVVLGARWWLDHAYGMDGRYALTQPLAVVMLLALLWHSAWRTSVQGRARWKGRTVHLAEDEATRTVAAARRDAQDEAAALSGRDST